MLASLAAVGSIGVAEGSLPLLLRAVHQDQHVFLAWNALPTAPGYVVHWRRVGTEPWATIDVGDTTRTSVTGLENGTAYEFRVVAGGTEPATSNLATAIPSARSWPQFEERECSAQWPDGGRVFCTQTAAAEWLSESGLVAGDFRCRNAPVVTWNLDSPDCRYSRPDGRWFLLMRDLRSDEVVFRPPADPVEPDAIRQVTRRLIWGGVNPFDNPESYPMELTPVANPDLRGIRGYSSAESFHITYHASLTSRITRFTPPNWVIGLDAIYHEGHSENALGALHDAPDAISDQLVA
jgi:hypothetical protein